MGRELDRVEAISMDPLQVPLPEAANCVSLRYQVAQKLHACTEVFEEGRENDRFRDVIDILLVEGLLHDVGLIRVHEACVDIFTVREKHTWPPSVTVYDSWRVPFAELARENGFTPEDIDEAAAALTGSTSLCEFPPTVPPERSCTRRTSPFPKTRSASRRPHSVALR